MLPRLYPRPFEKPAPVFQSGASGGRRLSRRIAFLRHRHRQALVAAGICSLAMHAVLGFAVRRYSPLAHPEPVVGYREGIDVIQGLVKLEAEVGANGKVLQVHVLHADDGSLAMSAAHALLLWEFHPFVLQGAPRPFRIVVPFRFRIQDRGEG